MTNKRKIIVGLDVGTSKIAILVGEVKSNGELEIIGKAEHPSDGIKQGVVVDIEATTKGIKHVVQSVELMTGLTIESVNVGIAGAHISCMDTNGIVAISNREVTQSDVDRVLHSAQTVKLDADHQILHVLPKHYKIDKQVEINQPIGMSGVRLEAFVHIVTCSASALNNLKKCIDRCNIKIDSFILQPLASSVSTLVEDEKELGVAVVDIGAGTTDLSIFKEGSILSTAVVPIAGELVTKDIAALLRTPQKSAEQIKLDHGCAHPNFVDRDKMIQVPRVGGRDPDEVGLGSLSQVIESRYEEILKLVLDKIRRTVNEEELRAGIVLTGGGSNINGLVELADEVLSLPIRIGIPSDVGTVVSDVKDPAYATAIGLLKYVMQFNENLINDSVPTKESSKKFNFQLSSIKNWFKKNL